MTGNPELRPDPRTASAASLLCYADRSARVDSGTGRHWDRVEVITLRRIVRDLVKVRDELRKEAHHEHG